MLYKMRSKETFLQVFESFIRKEDSKTLIVMDPPFGGMVEILAQSLKTISCPAGIFCPLKFMYLFLVSVGLIQSYLNRLCFTGAKENVKILPTLFFFPYYLQPRVSQYLPDFSMSDYRVNKHTFIASSNKYYRKN